MAAPAGPFQLDELKLAFAYHVIQEIVGADRHLDMAELSFVHRRFPSHVLQSCAFLDADGGFTERYRRALDEAMRLLPNRLTVGEKLEFLEIFAGAGEADGVLRRVERRAMRLAAEHLELPKAEWSRLVEERP